MSEQVHLLIVDDEEMFLESMRKRLEVRDFDVVCVDRGEKALEVARQKQIDIALVDLRMPGIDGEETLRRLKEEHEWMEVVILTGHGSIESAAACTQNGAYSYLQKPCEFEKLLDVLMEAFKKRVMRKKQLNEEQLNQLMADAMKHAPLAILRKLREIDEQSN